MRQHKEAGFTLIELLVVVAIGAALFFIGFQVLSGWRERNALTTVGRDVRFIMEKYRQKAVDKGYNYGMIFSNDGIYIFEDNGGTAADKFQAMNNFAIDPGEFSDKWSGGASGNARLWRRVTDSTSEFGFFAGPQAQGRIIVMTASEYNLTASRSGSVYSPAGTDITDSAVVDFGGGSQAPFAVSTQALFFSPDGFVYLKDPTVAVTPLNRFAFQLGNGIDPYYIVRIAYDDINTATPELPNYYEIAVNRYGASTFIRWNSSDGGNSWNANIQ